ncbi:peptidoglycan DD-metalloendopeptidase family protein [Bacillus taeanensis]|uniref:Peptidase M23 n=1 Tax=Bacillus taeanensis TaxID=273032 RepID=A0A366XSK9_9BACI|nr:M23 family metallopeptidase [Bacillus taeanensis]RBW69122.1 peptidase M23 [Bacillus taeanensis]
MSAAKKRLHKITREKLKSTHKQIKRIPKAACAFMIAASIFTAAPSSQVSAASLDISIIQTVYEVQVNGEPVGTVTDKHEVLQQVYDYVAEMAEDYNGMQLTIGSNIEFVPKKEFMPQYDNAEVVEKLSDMLAIKAEAIKIVIADKTVGYAKDEASAQAIIEQFKAQYVSEEVMQALEQGEEVKAADGESVIQSVDLSAEVNLTQEEVLPDQILPNDKILTLLNKGTLEEKKYMVKEGDVLGEIAVQYDLSVDDLIALNPSLSEESYLQIDQELAVTAYEPFLKLIVQEALKKEEAMPYETEIQTTEDLLKGETKVVQEGKEGLQEVTYQIMKENGQIIKRGVTNKQVIEEPTTKIVLKGTKVIPSRGTGSLGWPADGGVITSHQGMRWGAFHKGIDIAGPRTRSILAADNGTIVSAGSNGGYGNQIVINHNNGMRTSYSHLASINVSVGQVVSKGQSIGVMGSTGDSTGVHLHFEVYKSGELQNPMDYLK